MALGYGADVAGRGHLDIRISRLIARALRDAKDGHGLSRADVARAMSADLGRTVSPAMLDKFASESSVDHRIPMDAFIALVRASRAVDLLGFMPGEFGFAVVQPEHADLIEEQLLEDQIAEMKARQKLLAKRRKARR